jgi:hypothetical protein
LKPSSVSSSPLRLWGWLIFPVSSRPSIAPSRLKTFYRTIAATAVGVAVIARELTLYRTMEAVAVGVAAITTVATWYRTLAATAVGVATLLPAILKLVVMDAAAVGVAGLATVRTVVQSLDATAIGTAAITSVSTWYRTLAATAIGVANRSQVVTWYRTLAATAIGVPVIATVATWYRTLAATAVGLAELIALEVAYPEVEGYTDWNEPANTTAPTLTYPGSIAEDETLIAIVVTDGDNVVSGFPAGWAEIDSSDNGAAAHLSVWEKLALGTESGSFDITLGSSEQACGTIMRISGNSANWPSESPAISAATTGSDTSVEIANCAPGAGSKRFLWLAICGMDDDDLPTAIGDSFTDLLTLDSGSANSSQRLKSGFRSWSPSSR